MSIFRLVPLKCGDDPATVEHVDMRQESGPSSGAKVIREAAVTAALDRTPSAALGKVFAAVDADGARLGRSRSDQVLTNRLEPQLRGPPRNVILGVGTLLVSAAIMIAGLASAGSLLWSALR